MSRGADDGHLLIEPFPASSFIQTSMHGIALAKPNPLSLMPTFQKMREVLMVYQEVALKNPASASNEGASSVITVSLDEKPGVQAIENTAAVLPPVAA